MFGLNKIEYFIKNKHERLIKFQTIVLNTFRFPNCELNSGVLFHQTQSFSEVTQHSSALKNSQNYIWNTSFLTKLAEKCFLHTLKILMTDQMDK